MKQMDFPYAIGTVKKSATFRMEGHWTWCGSCSRDEETGLYHLFASAWPKSVPFSPNWLTHSKVVRAVSESLDGPFIWQEDLLLPRGQDFWDGYMTHNPTIHRHGEHWLLYYTGTRYPGSGPTASGPLFEPRSEIHLQSRANQRIGLAVATSPDGPWERADHPILEPRPGKWDELMTTNPAPVIHDDGSVLLYYKSCSSHDSPIRYGIAKADHWKGPYHALLDQPIQWNEEDTAYEDATVWRENGLYHMLFKDMGNSLTGEHHAGCYATSKDGLNWDLQGKGYSRVLNWDDGSSSTQGSLERPQVFLQDGKPIRLFCATADGPGGFSNADQTWTQILPLVPNNPS